ncbi:MAG: uL15m family ribosomal protein [Candidatus Njordarchaeales archaeon]
MPKIRLKRKEKKTKKLRGKRYSGYGQVSGGHRGKGQRGGKGMAGVKDHKRPGLLKEGYEYGSRGFTHHGPVRIMHAINIGKLVELASSGRISTSKEDGRIVIDLREKRITKILGGGRVSHPVKLIIDKSITITERAKEKIKAAGGEIVILNE